MYGTPEERFWNLVVKREDGCFEWVGWRNHNGYGVFKTESNKQMLAHRYAYEVKNGPIPEGKHVLHRCVKHPWCVNADHLELGDPKLNAEHRIRDGTQHHLSGSRNVNSKLTDTDIKWIRAWRREGYSLESLAVVFDVAYITVWNAVALRTYKDVK